MLAHNLLTTSSSSVSVGDGPRQLNHIVLRGVPAVSLLAGLPFISLTLSVDSCFMATVPLSWLVRKFGAELSVH